MKLYVFSDDELPENDLNELAKLFIAYSKKTKKQKRKISDEDIIRLAMLLDLPVEKLDKIMGW